MDWEYLKLSKQIPLIASFWSSPEYFERAGFREVDKNGIVTVWSDDLVVFPSIIKEPLGRYDNWEAFVWAAVEDPLYGFKIEFLDYNYIYNPYQFDDVSGKMWRLWRKNLNRFKKAFGPTEFLDYRFFIEGEQKKIETLFVKWLEDKPDEEILDDEVMMSWVLHPRLDRAKGLFLGDTLFAINIWDESYDFINYRYSIADPEVPFVNYKIRDLFYKDETIRKIGKLVNDGGVLDNKQLKFFKDHLNPVLKLKVNSWRKV